VILDQKGLRAAACECYALLRRHEACLLR
jgi:hypothetical protein